ncbi:MAG: DUF4932 domain-containing protein [Candidatus Symbiothrix sp.]|jgi:hypothetical protein|nr:DUF4932 domain-containing protein [Candidatus Symbiothrix sp.]
MKKFVLLWLFLIGTWSSGFSQLTSHVDERFELTSIAFRLAGAEEYINNQVVGYVKDIDAYFDKYKEHSLIRYIKEIRTKDEIAYNAVSSSTFLLKIRNNEVFLNPEADINTFLKSELRWTAVTLNKYVKLLNQFYKDAKFKTFYNQHKNLYAEAEKRFDELLKTIRLEWFQSFYGKPFGNPFIYISLCNGRSNYALLSSFNKTGSSDYGIIIGCTSIDKEGIPTFITYYDKDGQPYYDRAVLSVIIHEFSHYFSNPIFFKYCEQEMIGAANKIFPLVKEQLAKVAYGSAGDMIGEGLNELFSNMYFHDNSSIDQYNVAKDERYGFIWMSRAVRFMENFSANRILYPTIEDYMPQLIAFINSCGDNIEQIVDEYKHKNPYVVNVFPGSNTTVSENIKEIRVDFSHSMWGLFTINKPTQSNVIYLEIEPASCYWSEDNKTFIIPVMLERGKNYGLRLSGNGGFQSSETYPMIEDFEILFNTTE